MSEQPQPAMAEPARPFRTVWLDIVAAPDEKTGIQRLKVSLSFDGGAFEKVICDQYCVDGLIMQGTNLTWMREVWKTE